jgi:hypothetical protein
MYWPASNDLACHRDRIVVHLGISWWGSGSSLHSVRGCNGAPMASNVAPEVGYLF